MMEFVISLLALAGVMYTVNGHGRHVLDLTHYLDEDAMFVPDVNSFLDATVNNLETKYWLGNTRICFSDYGTIHRNGSKLMSVDDVGALSLERMMGPGVVIDLSIPSRLNPDTQLVVQDVIAWEAWNGQIPDHAMLTITTGWSLYWPNVTRILGTQNHSNPATYHYPGIHPETAHWLVKNRPQIAAILIDTPSLDFGQCSDCNVHGILANASIIVFENVANSEQLPPSGCRIYAIPIKSKYRTTSPARIFAVLHEHREKERDHFHLTTELENCRNCGSCRSKNQLSADLFVSASLLYTYYHRSGGQA